jgi:hypothetical protein
MRAGFSFAQRFAPAPRDLALGRSEQAHARHGIDRAGRGDGRLAPVHGADGLRHAARKPELSAWAAWAWAAWASARRRSAASRAARRRSA